MTNTSVLSGFGRRAIVAGVALSDGTVSGRSPSGGARCRAAAPGAGAAVLSSGAVCWAANRAVQTDRPLTVLVIEPARSEGSPVPVERACAGAEIADMVCARRPALTVVVEIVHGDAVEHLTAASEDAELVVLDASGGVSDAVVARARCPVAVIPAAGSPLHGDAPVVVGVKDLAGSAHLVRFAALEALRGGHPLTVIHSWTYPGPPVHDEAMTVLGREKERLLAELVDPIATALPELRVQCRVMQGRAEDTLVAASRTAALVVLGSREDRWRSPRLLGSTRRGILDRAFCPAATVPDAPAVVPA